MPKGYSKRSVSLKGACNISSASYECVCGYTYFITGDKRMCKKQLTIMKKLHNKKCEVAKNSRTNTDTQYTRAPLTRDNPTIHQAHDSS